MQPSRFHTEKRNFRRMAMDCPISYQVVNSPNSRMGTCINLSANGILFECDEKYPIGTRLNVNVSPKLAISPPFSAVVKILRIASDAKKSNYQLAAIIEDIH